MNDELMREEVAFPLNTSSMMMRLRDDERGFTQSVYEQHSAPNFSTTCMARWLQRTHSVKALIQISYMMEEKHTSPSE